MSVTQTATPGGVTVVTQTRVKSGKEDEQGGEVRLTRLQGGFWLDC
jgi:hypothetical protein